MVALTLVKGPILLASAAVVGAYHIVEVLCNMVDGFCLCMPLAFLVMAIAYAATLCLVAIGICFSALAKFVASFLWPAYISSGWLRSLGARRRRSGACLKPLVQGSKAAYQVLWAADLITNAFIYSVFDKGKLFAQVREEFTEMVRGDREALSLECRAISCLPPVIVGIFRGDTWDVEAVLVHAAQELNVAVDVVRAAWASLGEQMQVHAHEGVKAGLLTDEYVDEAPPGLVIGLPARVLLETIERSPGEDEILLASGLTVSAQHRPRTKFGEAVWQHLSDAKGALNAALPAPKERALIVASLLAGGAEADEMPAALAAACKEFDAMPAERRVACRKVVSPLIAAALECSREPLFCCELQRLMTTRGETRVQMARG